MKARADKAHRPTTSRSRGITRPSQGTQKASIDDRRSSTQALRGLQGRINAHMARSPLSLPARENRTGLPDALKNNLERLSGLSLNGVRVHFNSSRPAQLRARAYTFGSDIHIAPGQEKHLAHEAWHVIQQRQGRVKPTTSFGGKVALNTDAHLEREADIMGAKAASLPAKPLAAPAVHAKPAPVQTSAPVVQRYGVGDDPFPIRYGHLKVDLGSYGLLLNSSHWFGRAEAYEKRLGGYAATHKKAVTALNHGLSKLRAVLEKYYLEEKPKRREREKLLKEVFFKNDPTSAGQVGQGLELKAMNRVLSRGSLREKMTAFYNAAYYNAGEKKQLNRSFKDILHHIIFGREDALINQLGLDRHSIEVQSKYYQNSSTLMLGHVTSKFRKDVFALGNLTYAQNSSLSDSISLGTSQAYRTERTKTEQKQHANTPRRYEERGVPLSERELRHAFPEAASQRRGFFGPTLRSETRDETLPWREGEVRFKMEPSSLDAWNKKVRDQLRMPTIAGISGTTTRMLKAFEFLGTHGSAQDFRLALMGWMLPSGDHSLYEILRGSHLAGVKPDGEENRLRNVIEMYMNVVPLDTEELRANVAHNKMFPHEEVYVALATQYVPKGHVADGLNPLIVNTPEHLTSPTSDIARTSSANFEQAKQSDTTGRLTNISKAHAIALGAYTSSLHSLMNTIINSGVLLKKDRIKALLKQAVQDLFDRKPVEWPTILERIEKRVVNARLDPNPKQKQARLNTIKRWVDEYVDILYPELKTHISMAMAALNNLPSSTGVVYRGTWDLHHVPLWSVGTTVRDNRFISFSKNMVTALEFAERAAKDYGYAEPVLLELRLNGLYGKDLQGLSVQPREAEVLLPPHAGFKITGTQRKPFLKTDGTTLVVKVLTATEVR